MEQYVRLIWKRFRILFLLFKLLEFFMLQRAMPCYYVDIDAVFHNRNLIDQLLDNVHKITSSVSKISNKQRNIAHGHDLFLFIVFFSIFWMCFDSDFRVYCLFVFDINLVFRETNIF